MTDTLTWRVGDIRITRIQEWEGPGLEMLVPDATPENLAGIDWIAPFVDERGGHVTADRAPVERRDVLARPRDDELLMQRIKAALDPHSVFAD